MQTLGLQTRESLPAAINLVAAASALAAAYLAVGGALLWAGMISFSWGAPLLFTLETAGPGAFFAGALVFALNAYGLLTRRNWARRLSIALALAGLIMSVPDVSAAVVYVQPWRIVRTGALMIARVVVLWYLFQESTAAAFGRRAR